jgi:hypothetical protein
MLHRLKEIKSVPVLPDDKVAIIGSGPSGLTVARDPIRKGYPTTIFERFHTAGGMLQVGIPEDRLLKMGSKSNSRPVKVCKAPFSPIFLPFEKHPGSGWFYPARIFSVCFPRTATAISW